MKLSSMLRSLKSNRARSKRRARNRLLAPFRQRVSGVERPEDRRLLSATAWDSDSLGTTLNLSEALHVPDQVMVGFRSEGEIANLNEYLAKITWPSSVGQVGAENTEVILSVADEGNGLVNVAQVSLAAGADLLQAIEDLAGLYEVAYAAPNYVYEAESELEFTPNDPFFGIQYHHPLIGNPTAWDTTLGSSDIIVGITDTGVDWDHVDLADNIWSNPGETLNGIDDDGNGYTDDIRGWDFASNDNNPDESGGSTHGTHVSGIAAARTNNGVGVAGNSGRSTIMPMRISGSPNSAIYAGAFSYAADEGAHIVNTSFNIDARVGDPTFTNALQYLYDNDVLHFNSAGNGNQLNPPRQAFEQSLLVASTTSTDTKSSFSNYGTGIDVSAPGSSIYSTYPNDGYTTASGTSMASPNAAGVAALTWSAHPTWTRDQVAAQVVGTATNIDALNPAYAGLLGGGRVNSADAISTTLAAPQVDFLQGLPNEGASVPTNSVGSLFQLGFDQIMDPPSVNNGSNFDLTNAGTDGIFGTADDIAYNLTHPTYKIGTNRTQFNITNGPLVAGDYEFTVFSGGVQNPFFTALDGDGNSLSGGNFVRSFTLTSSGGGGGGNELITNGDFETGDFTGWVVSGGNGGWQINNGTYNPPGPGGTIAPIAGNFDAVSFQTGPGTNILSEPIVVPVDITTGTLSWSDRIRNYARVFSDPNQEFRVNLRDSGGGLIQEIFSTDPGDPLQQLGPNNRSFDVTTLLQSLEGQTIHISFEQQDNLGYFNATVDDISLFADTAGSVVANAGGPYTIDEGESLTLDASGSTASPASTYEWDVDGDGDFDEGVTGETVTLTWPELQALGLDDGPYTGDLSVRVTDPLGGGGPGIIEDFEDGSNTEYTQLGGTSTSVSASAAHDGQFGLLDDDFPGSEGWIYRDDPQAHLEQGDVFSVWTRTTSLNSSNGGRAYFGFGATSAGTFVSAKDRKAMPPELNVVSFAVTVLSSVVPSESKSLAVISPSVSHATSVRYQ